MSLTIYAKQRVVVRRVFTISHCRSVQIEGLAYKPSDRATSQQRAARQRAVWRASLETMRQRTVRRFVVWSLATRRKDNNDIGCVVAFENASCNIQDQPP
jgi:hypothetical protein